MAALRLELLTALLALASTVSCRPVETPFGGEGLGRLTGRVVHGGAPIAEARVWLSDGDGATRTGTDGRFHFESVPARSHALLVYAAEGGLNLPVRVLADRTLDVGDLELGGLGCVSGVVRLPDGTVAPPVEVEVVETGEWRWTRADGSFRFDLPPGRHRLRSRAVNLEDGEHELEARAGCATTPDLVTVRPTASPDPLVWYDLEPSPIGTDVSSGVTLQSTRFYLVGGRSCATRCDGKWAPEQVAAVQVLDLERGTWSRAPDLPEPRAGLRAGILGNHLYAVGGWVSGDPGAGCPQSSLRRPGQACPEDGCGPCYRDEVLRMDLETGHWEGQPEGVPPLPIAVGFGALTGDGRHLRYFGGVANGLDGYLGRVYSLGLGDEQWVETRFAGRRAHNLFACQLGGALYAFGGTSYRPGSAEDPSPAVCTLRVERHVVGAASSSRSAFSPWVASRGTGPCAALGRFLYFPTTVNPTSKPLGLVYDTADDAWLTIPVPDYMLPSRAVATPHGFVLVGTEVDHGPHGGRVLAAVAERFASDAESRYARTRLPSSLVELGPEDATDELAYEQSCTYLGCLESCTPATASRCLPGHVCMGGVCAPAACARCQTSCKINLDNERPATELGLDGERYLACFSSVCE